ncbi:MAG: DUF3352 domain-containing protein [Aphanothece sp. CMT-3BRIN-NPC111]|jgi:hypothetical protein|nr:DUF3352 domain-containing protein [Aphanothece sp. CMT-3BRIN-NPC111]
MKLRSFFYALIAGVLVLLLIGAGGFYWLTSRSPLTLLRGGETANPAAAIFVPKQAPAMVSLLVNPDRLEAFRLLAAAPGERRRSRAEINQIKQSLLSNAGLDYRQDIQPWLADEITWAVTTPDIDRDRQNGSQPGYLLVATTKDAKKSREFLQLFWQKQASAGTDLVFEQYKGVKLIYNNQHSKIKSKSDPLPFLASAVVGDRFVVFANNPKVLRDAINNVQAPNLSLNDSGSYQLALEKLKEPHIGLTFVNLPTTAAWLGNEQVSSTQEASRLYENLAIALSLNRQGLLAETSLLAAADQKLAATTPALSEPVGALQYLPAKSAIAAAGSNLNQLWNQLSAEMQSDKTLSNLLKQSLASLQDSWGIDLPQDIFSWVQGEYALGMLPRPDRSEPDWIFVAEKATGATVEASIEHLDAVAKQRGFSVGSLPLENQAITGWTKLSAVPVGQDQSVIRLEAQVQGVHTTAGKYEIFASSVEAMTQALKAPQNSLVASNNFKMAIAPVPAPNDGYLYLDWYSTQPILERQLPIFQVAELIGKPLFSHLRSLTVSSYGSDTGVQRNKLFFRLGSAKNQ